MDKFKILQLDDRVLLLNLYITQMITFVVGLILFFFQNRSIGELFQVTSWTVLFLGGLLFAASVLAVDILISKWVPEHVTDDGSINEKLFAKRPLWHIIVLSLVVAFAEEFLFRGVIQYSIGPYWTSIIFAAIHFRYLQHWVMTGLVFSISYGLGWLVDFTGMLWTAVFAHFLIDVIMGCMIRFGWTKEEEEQE